MAGVVLVDSCVFIQLLRQGRDPAAELTRRATRLDLATCGMVRVEVLRGIRNPEVRTRMDTFMGIMNNASTDNRAWEAAAAMAWQLDRAGITLPAQDIIIAVCALQMGATVLTYDGHFHEIPSLLVMTSLEELS